MTRKTAAVRPSTTLASAGSGAHPARRTRRRRRRPRWPSSPTSRPAPPIAAPSVRRSACGELAVPAGEMAHLVAGLVEERRGMAGVVPRQLDRRDRRRVGLIPEPDARPEDRGAEALVEVDERRRRLEAERPQHQRPCCRRPACRGRAAAPPSSGWPGWRARRRRSRRPSRAAGSGRAARSSRPRSRGVSAGRRRRARGRRLRAPGRRPRPERGCAGRCRRYSSSPAHADGRGQRVEVLQRVHRVAPVRDLGADLRARQGGVSHAATPGGSSSTAAPASPVSERRLVGERDT